MRRDRKLKMLFLMALVLSVTAMTLGFAAFSTTLNISSSASVTPNSEDFKLQMFGINGDNVVPITYQSTAGSTNGRINDDGISISGINVVLTKPGDSVSYKFIVKNVGEYDAYILSFKGNKFEDINRPFRCTAVDGVDISGELLEQACNSLQVNYGVYDINNNSLLFNNKASGILVPAGESIYVGVSYRYNANGVYADGAFNVEVGDLSMEFTTAHVPQTFSFTVSETTYYAEKDMTWLEWVESDYNVGNYRISGNTVYTDSSECTYVKGVSASDAIQVNGSYSRMTIGLCAGVEEW